MKTLLFVQLILLFCFSCTGQSAGITNEKRNVRGAAAVIRELPDEAAGFGSLSFISKVDIASPHDAVIKNLYFREGDHVIQGEQLLLLENPQINLAVERAENSYMQSLAAFSLANTRLLEGIFQAEARLLALEKTEAELTLAKQKWEEGNRRHQNQETLFLAGGIHTEAILVSRFNLETEWKEIQLMEKELGIRRIGCRDQDLVKAGITVPLGEEERLDAFISLLTSSLRAELDAAGARLEAAGKELASANIAQSELAVISPVSGVIGVRYMEEGERIRSQDKILTIIDSSSLYAIFPVREKDALRIEKGMYSSILIDGTGEYLDGAVDLVYPQADSQSLSFLVRVLLQNIENNSKLKPGMFVRAAVVLGPPREAVFISESAIFNQKNNEGSVFVINGSSLTERKITLGQVRGEEREINGLNTGELVVLRPDTDLREGVYVTLVE